MTTVPESLLRRLNDPHAHPAFRDGEALCPKCGLNVEDAPVVDGKRRCQGEP